MQRPFLALAIVLIPLNRARADDPLAPILASHLKPAVEVFLDHYRGERKYVNSDFPMQDKRFTEFKNEIKSELARTLGLNDWVVRAPQGKKSPVAERFEDKLVKTISLHGVTVELHVVTFAKGKFKVLAKTKLPRPITTAIVVADVDRKGEPDLVFGDGGGNVNVIMW